MGNLTDYARLLDQATQDYTAELEKITNFLRTVQEVTESSRRKGDQTISWHGGSLYLNDRATGTRTAVATLSPREMVAIALLVEEFVTFVLTEIDRLGTLVAQYRACASPSCSLP